MRFSCETPKHPEIEQACSKDPSRPVLCHPYLLIDPKDPIKGVVGACDSFVLVTIPVMFDKDDKPTSGMIPAEAFKALKKSIDGSMRVTEKEVKVFTRGEGVQTFERYDLGQFPRWDQLMPEQVGSFAVGLNAAFLARVAKAIGSEVVVLEFLEDGSGNPHALRSIRVRPSAMAGGDVHHGPMGLQMPIRVAS